MGEEEAGGGNIPDMPEISPPLPPTTSPTKGVFPLPYPSTPFFLYPYS